MNKITPHLWYDKEAREAAGLYTSVFPNSRIVSASALDNTPSGSVDMLTVELWGQRFLFISAGPLFKFTPAVSFMVACDTKEQVDTMWQKLLPGGSALMELGAYPFSERYGWLHDKCGLSWQLIFVGNNAIKQRITPSLLFVGKNAGRAEEAIGHYTTVFHDAKVGDIFRYGANQAPDREGTITYAGFRLEGYEFAAMDSAREHNFTFNEAVSFIVNCDNQQEIDYYWGKLSADPKAEQCGWLKDKYGLSWQIVPSIMGEMLGSNDKSKTARVTEAFLKMKKFDIATLQAAYDGRPTQKSVQQ
jgi:predicted 3-demethylubiquinone-9 3-methyltransferase (glyoxalase superfamily)